jgi:ABC-2 type transport system permease protein
MKKFLRTYWPFAANEIKTNFAYKGSFYLFILSRLFGVFIAYFLWMAIYGSSTSPVLGGLTQSEMIVYIFMSYVATGLISINISGEIGFHVVEGSIASNLIKPIDYRTSLLFKALGTMIYRFFIPSLFIWIGLEGYKVFRLKLPVTGILNIILFLISCILSFLIYIFFDFCFGMLAFYTTYIFGMAIVKNALLSFLTGQLIPLSFFPEAAQKIFAYLPFASMNYVPVMIYLGKYSGNEILFVLGRQLLWVVLLFGLGSLLWNRITKKLIVLGG